MSVSLKRENSINWHQFFFGVAYMAAMRSKDPSTQCGACIVSENRVIGIGYNGLVKGFSDDTDLIWGGEEKKKYILHAEENALLNCRNSINDLSDCEMYLWTSSGRVVLPCDRCARMINQSGVKCIHVMERSHKAETGDNRWDPDIALAVLAAGDVNLVCHDVEDIHGALSECATSYLNLG